MRGGRDRAGRTTAASHALALASARAEVAACEAALSRFDAASDLSPAERGRGRVDPVDRRLVEALRLALRAREDTGGRFDPTVLPALVAAGYDRSFEQLAERPAERGRGLARGRARSSSTTRPGVVRLEPGAAVDLGGIGKGYAAVAGARRDARRVAELPGGLVDLGGDIALRGDDARRRPWRIRVADPRRPGATPACSCSTPAASPPPGATSAASGRAARSTT